MHEERLLRDLLRRVEAAAREHGLARVTRVRLWVGALAHLDGDQVRARFAELARGGPADGAEVAVERSESLDDPRAGSIVLRGLDGTDGAPESAPS